MRVGTEVRRARAGALVRTWYRAWLVGSLTECGQGTNFPRWNLHGSATHTIGFHGVRISGSLTFVLVGCFARDWGQPLLRTPYEDEDEDEDLMSWLVGLFGLVDSAAQ